MAQINKPSEYFNTKLYTGTGATQSITGVNFQPDLVWIKNRQDTYNHHLFDVIRGVEKEIRSDSDNAETTISGTLTSFDSDGFTLGSTGNTNFNGNNHVSWNWLGGGTGVSNTDGSITSTVSANTTSGFSVVSYTGTGSNATVGHGLGSAPKMVIVKNLSTTSEWIVYNKNLTSYSYRLVLNNTDAQSNTSGSEYWTADPTSSVFSIGTNFRVNGSSNNLIAYCFAEKKGFSKFGSYTGNANDDGPFLYTGFKPAFLMTKRTDSTGNWMMWDNGRNTFNGVDKYLWADSANAEGTVNYWDFISNGCKNRNAAGSGNSNASGGTYIYMAFAENPLVGTNGVPTTAR